MNVLPFSNESDIAVVGWACRVPGANSVEELWSLLRDGKCAVTSVPADRFPLERYGHPKRSERGRSYTWAAGVIDNIWEFDPSVFGISPREAVQMDPQQRLLLQLTWEALEDAGIRPSTIAGTEVGVYMGACQVEYSHRYGMDESIGDSHFATGTSLAVISNRISYIFDFHGPSMTIDTACSSSMVALHEAVAALRSGRIDTAIVGGVNIIASPGSFIAFSQASMLSPTGLCQAFSANADGFVRAEGAGVLILQNANRSDIKLRPIHGYVVATDVNSDGRTTGISLPSLDGQEALLKRLYRTSGVDPNRLAFVEAHGTGTAAGDPIEATALGHCLGLERSNPLIIGSIKTNIGHLEPAAGVAGLIKAFLALNHGVLPPSLHFNEPSAHIAFDELNLAVCDKVMLLPNAATQLAGVNSFGFGGTNAHAIIGPGKKPVSQSSVSPQEKTLFMLSAATKPALAELARDYSAHVANLSKYEITAVANAVVHRRERLGERLVVSADDGAAISNALSAYAADQKSTSLVSGSALGEDLPVAFVFSGNGSQWVGMGRSALASNPRFASHFDALDAVQQGVGRKAAADAGGPTASVRHPELGKCGAAFARIFADCRAGTQCGRDRCCGGCGDSFLKGRYRIGHRSQHPSGERARTGPNEGGARFGFGGRGDAGVCGGPGSSRLQQSAVGDDRGGGRQASSLGKEVPSRSDGGSGTGISVPFSFDGEHPDGLGG
jgi:phthiocerol/phenolphthiocerol synthesis type-I polyketide synthase C